MEDKYFEEAKRKVLEQLESNDYKKAYGGTEQGKLDKNHFLEVVKIASELWIGQEETEPPLALILSALYHDIDRIYPQFEVNTKDCAKENYENRKGVHSGTAALIFFEQNSNLPKALLHDVCFLILRHECGGDTDKEGNIFDEKDEFTGKFNLHIAANILYYADKLSFFYSAIHEYKKRGEARLKLKISFSLKGLPSNIIDKVLQIPFEDPMIKRCIKSIVAKIRKK